MTIERQIHDVLEKVCNGDLNFNEGFTQLKKLIGDLLPESELFSAVDDASTRFASVRIIHLELVNQLRGAQEKQHAMAGPKKSNGERPGRRRKLAVVVLALTLSGALDNHHHLRGADTMSSPAASFMV